MQQNLNFRIGSMKVITTNLNSFIYIEAQSGGVTEEGDDDNGEEEGHHGGVSPVVRRDGVVQGGSSEMGHMTFVPFCA